MSYSSMIPRYSNPKIRSVWDLENKFHLWLKVELAVCAAWAKRGFIPENDFNTLKEKAAFQVKRIDEIEKEVHHDVIAFVTNVRENTGLSGRYLHYGLTSSDVIDTALGLQLKESTTILLDSLDQLIDVVWKQAIRYKNQVMIGRTHGIHGEPTTLGLKLAVFYAELKRGKKRLLHAGEEVFVGKLSGAVGTFSNIDPEIEEEVCLSLGLKADPISTQIVNRDRHAHYLSVLGVLAGSLERMAQEIRLLQKTEGREVEEPFVSGQKGSSAMPHKRNPVICERICGLARVIQSNVQVAYRNIPLWHERDISHSSAERIIFPDSIISMEYILEKMNYVISNIHVYPENMAKVLQTTRGLWYSQRLLLKLVEKGMQREEAYSNVQSICMKVWSDSDLHLQTECRNNKNISSILSHKEQDEIFQQDYYLRNVDSIFQRLHP